MSLKIPKSEFIKSTTIYNDRMIELVEQMSKNVMRYGLKRVFNKDGSMVSSAMMS